MTDLEKIKLEIISLMISDLESLELKDYETSIETDGENIGISLQYSKVYKISELEKYING